MYGTKQELILEYRARMGEDLRPIEFSLVLELNIADGFHAFSPDSNRVTAQLM